jgi:hypothetical protein
MGMGGRRRLRILRVRLEEGRARGGFLFVSPFSPNPEFLLYGPA